MQDGSPSVLGYQSPHVADVGVSHRDQQPQIAEHGPLSPQGKAEGDLQEVMNAGWSETQVGRLVHSRLHEPSSGSIEPLTT